MLFLACLIHTKNAKLVVSICFFHILNWSIKCLLSFEIQILFHVVIGGLIYCLICVLHFLDISLQAWSWNSHWREVFGKQETDHTVTESNKIGKSCWGIMWSALHKGRWELTVRLWPAEPRNLHLGEARRKRIESMWTWVPGLCCSARLWPLHAPCVPELTASAAPPVNSCICHIFCSSILWLHCNVGWSCSL